MLKENLLKVWDKIHSPDFSLSFSSLNELLTSNLHFARYVANRNGWFDSQKDADEYNKKSDAVVLGDCLDSYIFDRLGNTKLGRNDGFRYYAVKEALNLTKKADKDLYAQHLEKANGRDIIRLDGWQSVLAMANMIEHQPYGWGLLNKWITDIQQEVEMFDEVIQTKIRGRYDAIGIIPSLTDTGVGERYVVDLKSMQRGVDDSRIAYDARARRYHLQAWLYKTMLSKKNIEISDCYLVGVAKDGCNVKKWSMVDLVEGETLYKRARARFANILFSNEPTILLQSYTRVDGLGWSYM